MTKPKTFPPFGTALPDIPLRCICDGCKAEGLLAMPPFTDHGDLLDFTPVPRRLRGDGWLPGLQRLFIAALALTGSRNKAVHVVGKVNASVEHLRWAPGGEEFAAAYDRALSLYEERHLATGIRRFRDLAGAGQEGAEPPRPEQRPASALPPPAPRLTPQDVAAKLAELARMLDTKLAAEQRLRGEGRLPEANLALRQATRIEITMELTRTTEPATVDEFMAGLKTASGVPEIHVLDTAATRASDAERRAKWEGEGAPPRPVPLPGPGNPVGLTAGIEEREDCRLWTGAIRGGPDWQLRDHQSRVAMLKREFDGERE